MNSAKYSYTKEVYEPFSQENKLGEILVKGVRKSKINDCIKTVASKRKVKNLFEECPNSQCSQCPESLSDQIIAADTRNRSSVFHTPEEVVSSDLKKRSVDYDSGDDFVTPLPKKLATRNKGKRVSKGKKSGNRNSEKTAKITILDDVLVKEGNSNLAKTSPLSGVECLDKPVLPYLKNICENFDPNLGGNVEILPPGFKEYSQEVNPDSVNYESQNFFKSAIDDALEDIKSCQEKLASQISNLDETDMHLKSLVEHDAQNLSSGELRRRFDALVNGSAAKEEDIGNPPTENSGGSCQTEGKNLELELIKAKRDIVLARKKFHMLSFEIKKREFEREEREYRKGLDLLEKELSDLDADISRS